MPDLKISELPAADPVSGSELYAIVQDGETRRSLASAIQAYISTGGSSIVPNAQTSTSYVVQTTDRGKLVTHSNGSAIAVTLPQAGVSFPSGWFYFVQNRGAGTVTITPTTSTIDGAASLAVATGQGALIASDGTNYFTSRGVGTASGAAGGVLTGTFPNPGIQTSLSLTTPILGVAAATSINKVAITAPATSATLTIADGKTLTASNTLSLAGTDGTTMTFPPASASVGYLNIPQNSQSADYTTLAADSGKSIDHPSTDGNARTFTIDSNANVPYPLGTCITFTNMTSQVVTIAITADTLYLAGTGTTGSRSLAQYGIATARKLTSTTWLISGTGLT